MVKHVGKRNARGDMQEAMHRNLVELGEAWWGLVDRAMCMSLLEPGGAWWKTICRKRCARSDAQEPGGCWWSLDEPGGKHYTGSDIQEAICKCLVELGKCWWSMVEPSGNVMQEAICRKRYTTTWWMLVEEPGGKHHARNTRSRARLVICFKQITRRARERVSNE